MLLAIRGLYATLWIGSGLSLSYAKQIKESIPSLAEMGGEQLYPADPTIGKPSTLFLLAVLLISRTDRRPALLSILNSLLASYSSLTASLLAPPPTASTSTAPEWQRHVEWIAVMAQNIMAAANDLRPVQVYLVLSL
jgi:mediator of RNA polymerase II transcription subunit 7